MQFCYLKGGSYFSTCTRSIWLVKQDMHLYDPFLFFLFFLHNKSSTHTAEVTYRTPVLTWSSTTGTFYMLNVLVVMSNFGICITDFFNTMHCISSMPALYIIIANLLFRQFFRKSCCDLSFIPFSSSSIGFPSIISCGSFHWMFKVFNYSLADSSSYWHWV